MSTGPKGSPAPALPTTGRRGGYRPGAGRPASLTLSARQVKSTLAKAKERAKATGKDVDDILLDIIFGQESASTQDQLAAIKLWKDYTMARISEGSENDKCLVPQIYLPELMPDSAKAKRPLTVLGAFG